MINLQISPKLAQKIVVEMKDIINQEVNYMDIEGKIIASTDSSRIGTFHGGAKRVLETNEEVVIKKDGQYKGALKGINLPIYFNKSIVGVIGITGETEEVKKYGRIIKKMTEFLITEEYNKTLQIHEKEVQRLIIEDLLFNDILQVDQQYLENGHIFQLKDNIQRVVIVAKLYADHDKDFIFQVQDDIYQLLLDHIRYSTDNLLSISKTKVITILRVISRENILYILRQIARELKNQLNIKIHFGVGTFEKKIEKLRFSFEKANVALEWTLLNKCEVIFYDDLDLELIVSAIKKEEVQIFVQKVLGCLDKKSLIELYEILPLFEKYNGSLKQISEDLFIHKNTLQYRLNKLAKKTNYDMRNYKDFSILKLAVKLKHYCDLTE